MDKDRELVLKGRYAGFSARLRLELRFSDYKEALDFLGELCKAGETDIVKEVSDKTIVVELNNFERWKEERNVFLDARQPGGEESVPYEDDEPL